MEVKPCEACEGNGWLVFSDNTLQRCDMCEQFRGDLDAAIAFFAAGGKDPFGIQYRLRDIILEKAP